MNWWILASSLILTVIGIIAHEFGHLAFGYLTGYRFSSFRLGALAWFKEDGRLRFTISKNWAAGQCVMVPAEEPENFKFVLYNLGGVIFNFLLSAMSFALVIIFSDDNIWETIFIQSAAINFLLALVNLVPVKAWTNDGANILEALKSKDAARGLYMMFHVNNELSKGMRYRDFDKNLFKSDENAEVDNYLEAYLILFEAARLEDSGEYDAFVECLKRINMKKMPGIIKSLIEADLLYYYTFYKLDHSKARTIYKDKKLNKTLKMPLPGFARIAAAYEFLVEKDIDKGQKLLEKGKRFTENLPSKGQRIMEMEYIQKLEDVVYGQ